MSRRRITSKYDTIRVLIGFCDGLKVRRTAGGFSLVEILIALLILGVGVVGVFNLFPLGLQSLTLSRRLNEVALLAEKKLEELKLHKPVPVGTSSGTEGTLNWRLTVSPEKLEHDMAVLIVELDIEDSKMSSVGTQRFVTYLSAE